MKIILRIFSRNFLIRISYYLVPILKIVYSGKRFIDPIDGKGYSKFLSYGYTKLRKNALCPGTLSLERHRLLWLYLCLLYTSPSPRDRTRSRMPSSA